MSAAERGASIELVAVGDVSLGDSPQVVGTGVRARFDRVARCEAAYPFTHVAGLFAGADVVFGNLETPLSQHGANRWNASTMEMRGHPDGAQRLAAAGFTVLNVANNHMMQHGAEAFWETVSRLRAERLDVVGLASADHRSCVPMMRDVNGLRVAVLAFAFEPDKYATGPVEYAFAPDCDIVAEVASARREADVVICSLHWGVEFVPYPSAAEETLARRIVDAGAALLLGHHPHVARRVERRGNGLIAYSLGNFVFDQVWSPSLRTGLLVRATLARGCVAAWSTELLWIGDDFQPRRFSPEQRADRQRILDLLADRPDWVEAPDQYASHYERLADRNRYESYRHFLRTLSERPVSYSVQTLVRTARRKALAAVTGR
jgi:poly-gamma-glutamate synthesis protein (capsule biosynthesis protein)